MFIKVENIEVFFRLLVYFIQDLVNNFEYIFRIPGKTSSFLTAHLKRYFVPESFPLLFATLQSRGEIEQQPSLIHLAGHGQVHTEFDRQQAVIRRVDPIYELVYTN